MKLAMSKLGLFGKCRWFARDDITIPKETYRGSKQATVFRRALALGPNLKLEAFEELVKHHELEEDEQSEVEGWLAAWNDDEIARSPWTPGAALAWDTIERSARWLGATYEPTAPTEITGRPDFYHVTPEKVFVVAIVTGWNRHLTQLSDDRKLRAYALALCSLTDRSTATIIRARVDQDAVTVTEFEYYSWDLEELADELQMASIDTYGAEPVPGPYCNSDKCPARTICPATATDMVQIVPKTARGALELKVTSHDQIADALPRLKVAEDFIDAFRTSAKSFVDKNGPVPLGNNTFWGATSVPKEYVTTKGRDWPETKKMLEEKGFSEAIEMKPVVTKKALEGICRLHGKPIAKGVSQLMSDLRGKGLTTQITETHYTEYTEKPQKQIDGKK